MSDADLNNPIFFDETYAPSPNMAAEIPCLSDADVIPYEVDDERIVFASLYNYTDNKDESNFHKIYLPPICVKGIDLYNMFYIKRAKTFSPFVLNSLLRGINRNQLKALVLSNYEASTGLNRADLTAQQKIMLAQELNLVNINGKIQKIVHLDSLDFNYAVSDGDMEFNVHEVDAVEAGPGVTAVTATTTFDVRASIEILLYSNALQNGIKLIVQFIASFDLKADFCDENYPQDGENSVCLEFTGALQQPPIPPSILSMGLNKAPTPRVPFCIGGAIAYTPTDMKVPECPPPVASTD